MTYIDYYDSQFLSTYGISESEYNRICTKANSDESFVSIWANKDWWIDANNEESV